MALPCVRTNYSTAAVKFTRALTYYLRSSDGVGFIRRENRVLFSSMSTDVGFQCLKPYSTRSGDLFLNRSFFGRGGFSFAARAYSSPAEMNGKDGVLRQVADNSAAGAGGSDDWGSGFNHVYQSVVSGMSSASQKAKEASDSVVPHIREMLDAQPILKDVILPVSGTLFGTAVAWMFLPRILKRLHKYSVHGPTALLYGPVSDEDLPYQKSCWAALEDPLRYLVTFLAFAQLSGLVAPSTIAAQYYVPACKGAVVLSFLWFLYRWKTNVFARALASKSGAALDKDKLLVLDKLSSVGLIALALIASAEVFGVPVQSILTVGGIGGFATAFAARDVLGNMLSGLSVQFAKPFSMGDTIKAGSIEGQVVEMGLTSTSLLTSEKFPVIVPNSLFSSQAIVNKSRAEWRAIVMKVPLKVNNLQKIPIITQEVKEMLLSNPKVYEGKEAPYCFLSGFGETFAELTVGCNLKIMKSSEFYSAQQEILLKSAQIITNHGVDLACTR